MGLTPRSALLLGGAFVAGAAVAVARAEALTVSAALTAIVTGLAALVVARFATTAIAEYRPRDGSLAAAVFLLPLVAGAVAAAAVWLRSGEALGAFWGGFWTLVAAVFLTAVGAQVAAGYRAEA